MRQRSSGRGYDPPVSNPPRLKRIPEPETSPADKARVRVSKIPRPDGMLQCPRCGGRTVLTARAGVIVKDGRVAERGTLLEKDVCGDCWPTRVKMVPGGQGPKLVR